MMPMMQPVLCVGFEGVEGAEKDWCCMVDAFFFTLLCLLFTPPHWGRINSCVDDGDDDDDISDDGDDDNNDSFENDDGEDDNNDNNDDPNKSTTWLTCLDNFRHFT